MTRRGFSAVRDLNQEGNRSVEPDAAGRACRPDSETKMGCFSLSHTQTQRDKAKCTFSERIEVSVMTGLPQSAAAGGGGGERSILTFCDSHKSIWICARRAIPFIMKMFLLQ